MARRAWHRGQAIGMVFALRIAALSDFHIAPVARADGFRHDEDRFLEFLDQLEASHEMIVLLGDVYQTEHGWLAGRRAEARQLARARARLARLSRRIADPPYVYVHGNHDAVSKRELGALTSLRIARDQFCAYFIHGHQFDPLLHHIYPLARLATWCMGRLRHAGLGAIAGWFEHKDITTKQARFGGPDGPYARAARHLLQRERADVVVMGHTHVPVKHALPEGVLINTGSCSLGQRMYVSIDTEARTVELIRG